MVAAVVEVAAAGGEARSTAFYPAEGPSSARMASRWAAAAAACCWRLAVQACVAAGWPALTTKPQPGAAVVADLPAAPTTPLATALPQAERVPLSPVAEAVALVPSAAAAATETLPLARPQQAAWASTAAAQTEGARPAAQQPRGLHARRGVAVRPVE
jgi:hypothetical protein